MKREESAGKGLTTGFRGNLVSGGIWYAFYGRKGDPIISANEFKCEVTPMGHDGRFFNPRMKHGGPTRVSAAVLLFPKVTIVFENPNPAVPLPSEFRINLLRLPRFEIGRSYMNLVPGAVSSLVDIQHQMIGAVAKGLSMVLDR